MKNTELTLILQQISTPVRNKQIVDATATLDKIYRNWLDCKIALRTIIRNYKN